MLSKENAVEIESVGKCYKIYKKPKDKLKEIVLPWKNRYYEEFWALKDINVEIKKGEQLSIIGRNGSGKSTLLQLICGTIEASEGIIQKQGKIAALLELGSGFNPEFTGIENIYLNAAIFGISKKQIEQKLDSILGFADIGEFVHQKVKTYSSGMQVRLAFAVIAHLDAEIMICDEALAVGDAVFTQKCMRFINNFKATGTLIFVSHDMASVAAITEKCLWLKNGRIEYLGNTKKAIQKYDRYCQEQGGYIKKNYTEEEMKEPKRVKQHKLENPEETIEVQEAINYSNKILKCISETKVLAKMEQTYKDGHFDGLANIKQVYLITEQAKSTKSLKGGMEISLMINGEVNTDLENLFWGYQVMNSKGQIIFAQNTLVEKKKIKRKLHATEEFNIQFQFIWPWLAAGTYTITVAISSGTWDNHTNHHWINEALVFEQLAIENMCVGIFLPLTKSIQSI